MYSVRSLKMAESRRIAVLTDEKKFESLYSFLVQKNYELIRFDSIAEVLESPDFYRAGILIIDTDERDECYQKLSVVNQKHSRVGIILVWDFRHIIHSENIPQIFYFIKKPFPKHHLAGIVERYFTGDYSKEKRKEPRIPIELPVALFYKTGFKYTRTKNLSLHGMQTFWLDKQSIHEITEAFKKNKFPISACRLYLSQESGEYINIPVVLQYVAKEKNKPTLMGFKFRSLDLDLRTELFKIITK